MCYVQERQEMTPFREGDESAGLSGSSQAVPVDLHPSINSFISTIVLEGTSCSWNCAEMYVSHV